MANKNSAGFGLIPSRVLGQSPATAGYGQYWIDNADSTAIYNGEAVYSSAGSITGAQGSATTVTLGVLQGVFYNAATTNKPTWSNYFAGSITPANSEDVTCFVIDNPFQLFAGSTSAAVTQANVGRTVSFAAAVPTGSEISGQCTNTMNIGGINDTTQQWRIIRNAEDPENKDQTAAYCTMIFAQNLGQYLLNSATAGNDWTI